MNPRVVSVHARKNFTLELLFENQEKRLFDATPFLKKGLFKELQNPEIFATASVFDGTVRWIHDQDLCPDTLYLHSHLIPKAS